MTETLSATAAIDAPSFGLRLSPAGGVAMTGADLSQPLSPALQDAIFTAFRDHHILVFRDQDLSQNEQLAFTQQFGEIEEHVARHSAAARYGLVHLVTNVGDDGQPTTNLTQVGNYLWHTDKSYHAVPSLMTVLHAKELPPEGGDTQFANMAMAYDALPEAAKRQIVGMRRSTAGRRAGAGPEHRRLRRSRCASVRRWTTRSCASIP